MNRTKLLAATAFCCALVTTTSPYAHAQSVHDGVKTFGAPLPQSVLAELRAKHAISTHKAHAAAENETADAFPEAPAPANALNPTAGATNGDAPVNTQLKTADGKPYYYDENHEFHPGDAPPPPKVAPSGGDGLGHGQIQMADATHDTPTINDGITNGGGNASDKIPVGSNGQPLTVYNEGQEDKNAELNEALKHMMPEPLDIMAVRSKQRMVHSADAAPLQNYKPTIRSINLSLAPGHEPPMIHLAYGVTTSITFSDVTGAPWYISRAITDASSYSATSSSGEESEKTNIVTISPLKDFTQGRNLTVFLEHSAVPVIFQLETGSDPSVDYRVDTSISQRGPNAREDYVESALPATDDAMMVKFVDGTPPKGARRIKSDNPAVEAWRYQKMMFVRSEMPMMSPQPLKYSAGHISGIQVYGLRPTPDIVVSNHGELVTVRLGE